MRHKINHPFIYFFIEPDVVFVYKINPQVYVTVDDLVHTEDGQTFELHHPDEFETFNHRKQDPLIGKGYVLSYDSFKKMAEIMNEFIHRVRSTYMAKMDKNNTFHIVSSDSAAGSLRFGLDRPKTVIGYPGYLSIGPISKLENKIDRKHRYGWLRENINLEMEDFEYENSLENTLLEIKDIPEQAPIYLWYGDNANEQIGVRYLLHLLRDRKNEIFLINSTELYDTYLVDQDEDQPIIHTGQMTPDNLKKIYENNKKAWPLSLEDKKQFQKEWESLSQSEALLRVWTDKELKNTSEDYFDSYILDRIEKLHKQQEKTDFILAGRIIGEILNEIGPIESDFFIEYRLRHLIYHGVLELKGIPKSMRHYRVKIR